MTPAEKASEEAFLLGFTVGRLCSRFRGSGVANLYGSAVVDLSDELLDEGGCAVDRLGNTNLQEGLTGETVTTVHLEVDGEDDAVG